MGFFTRENREADVLQQQEKQDSFSTEKILENVIQDYTSKKSSVLINMKRGIITKEEFLDDVKIHIYRQYNANVELINEVITDFEQFIFGYSKITTLIEDPEVTDIRCISYNNIRIKKNGTRMDAAVEFTSKEEYVEFVKYVASKNQVGISNMTAIQRFTDISSNSDYILRFTISMPLVNTYDEPYLCIRKIPKDFPEMPELVRRGMFSQDMSVILQKRFCSGSTLIVGGNSAGKTTLLNALKETLPENMAVLVEQQADELTTKRHPDMMFLHSLPKSGESSVSYDLEDISIAGLTMDIDYFIIGEVKGAEAMYLLNAAYTGQICAATVHGPSAVQGINKVVDYAMYNSRYNRTELMKMMACFKTVIFMNDYSVTQVYEVVGWNDQKQDLDYKQIL